MAASFLFYDLETSGFDARNDRIMQFAGIRTNKDLEPIGEPYNVVIKMTPDTVPSPDAIMVTGITPQSTMIDGLTEAEFLKYFYDEIVRPDTCFLGFNTVRFDDEFMRALHYRNFYDPYEWQWANGCSRWDLLDAVRMTRALRPDGIIWPFSPEGKPTNRLELITKLNGIDHYAAHDALSDVHATIAVARLIRDKQPKLFDYLFEARSKKAIQALVDQDAPFVYSSGRYPSEFEKTTVAIRVADNNQGRGVYVYDLRNDPAEFADFTPAQLLERMQYTKDEAAPKRLPVKMVQYNHCPAVAPMGVLDDASRERLKIDLPTIQRHLHALKLAVADGFADRISQAMKLKDESRDAYIASRGTPDVDAQIYDGFLQPGDKQLSRAVRVAAPVELMSFENRLSDDRLKKLLPRYKARNYPENLTSEERETWETFCRERLLSGGNLSPLARYFTRLQELAASAPADKAFLLEELQLYGQSIMPVYDGE
jgi:exodeoxyribonuclease-1